MAVTQTLIVGNGRMGALVRETLAQEDDFEVIGMVGIENMGDLISGAPEADLVIDFSHKDMLPSLVTYVGRTHCALLTGTTGFDEHDLAALAELGKKVAVVQSANYSLGVAVLRRISNEAAAALEGWDIEIVETHHNQKVDAPSGTAMALLASVDPDGFSSVRYGREGMVGARPAREIGMHALRGGTVAGTHEVHLFGTDEEVCLVHRATSRQIFVNGAIACARRLMEAGPGLYDFDSLMFA